ncbi:KdsC family phosphatase [Sandaracinus amylolyticus]|uniref:3-deoxy-D-manno-octulosonate 8-phosphate phosphatase n=1 Tax=Sandaracinus amylolyticus TaxID=927083 RepID=A0A0F6SH16_9BACT|nr:HAD hydrolase family protein [Sandaracinus amylolyticus]AKF09659.1 3-deoxy-D-manno-octulosonate 8-phosphate phosphatase [Sandaracinus amylolyticus]
MTLDGVALREKLAAVRALALDVDGVLTDGSLTYGADGEVLKTFHVRDGMGMRLVQNEGIAVAVITAKRSPMLVRRLADLKVAHLLDGREDKGVAIAELAATLGVPLASIAFVGDDVLDLPAMRAAGVGIAVADAHPLVREAAAWVTRERGGRGAVREVCDALLDARGRLRAACEELLRR